MKLINKCLSILIFSIILSCSTDSKQTENNRFTIVCTTNIIADAVKELVGDQAEVLSIMGPGVDPHLYKASQGDLQKFRQADLIFYNGLYLEGKMAEILEKLGRSQKTVALAELLPDSLLIATSEFGGSHDPHIWFDVQLWKLTVDHIHAQISELNPELGESSMPNLINYQQKLSELDNLIKEQLRTIPENQRVLITAHDAFSYFGKAYAIEVRGLQGISTLSEYGLRDVSDLVNFIVTRDIKAVFVETSISERSIKAVVEGCKNKGHQVIIGGELYSDALGSPDGEAGNYINMLKHNVTTITNALQ